jgi:hypothetical protein
MLNITFRNNLLKALFILGMISSSVYTITAQAQQPGQDTDCAGLTGQAKGLCLAAVATGLL